MLLNKDGYAYLKKRLKIYMIVNIACIVSVYLLIGAEAAWVEKKSEAVIIPEFKYTYPMIPYMPVSSREMNEAKLYTFVEQYVKRVYDERMVDYHKPSNMGRSDTAYLKNALLEAAEMSRGQAKKEVLEQFADSQETFTTLKQCNCGWIFNILAIESIQKTNYHDTVSISVLGEYQVTYDQVKADLPHKLWGFKRIWLTVVQGRPSRDSKGNFKNEYGLYVIDKVEENLNYDHKDKLLQQVHNKGYFVP